MALPITLLCMWPCHCNFQSCFQPQISDHNFSTTTPCICLKIFTSSLSRCLHQEKSQFPLIHNAIFAFLDSKYHYNWRTLPCSPGHHILQSLYCACDLDAEGLWRQKFSYQMSYSICLLYFEYLDSIFCSNTLSGWGVTVNYKEIS